MYVNDIITGACKPNEKCKLIKEGPATALVDAMSVLGATSAHFCMEIAIGKAKKTGVGWVSVKGSFYKHYGCPNRPLAHIEATAAFRPR